MLGASHFRKNTGEEFQNPYSAVKQNGISAKVGCSPYVSAFSLVIADRQSSKSSHLL